MPITEKLHPQLVESAYKKIDQRIGNFSIPTIQQTVELSVHDKNLTVDVVRTCRAALYAMYFLDFHAETDLRSAASEEEREVKKQIYLTEARKQFGICYKGVPEQDRFDLARIQHRVVRFFGHERDVWKRIQREELVPTKDIMRVWGLKSSDALFYGRIIQSMTGRDFSRVLYANMRLLDIRGDLMEMSDDVVKNSPNMVVAMLANKIGFTKIPKTDSEILEVINSQGVNEDIESMLRRIMGIVSRYDQLIRVYQDTGIVSPDSRPFVDTIVDLGQTPSFEGYTSVRKRMDDNSDWIRNRLEGH